MLTCNQWDYAWDIMRLLRDVADPAKHIKLFDYATLRIMYDFVWDRYNTEEMHHINSLVIAEWHDRESRIFPA